MHVRGIRLTLAVALLALMTSSTRRAEAQTTYSLNGTFGTDLIGSTGLAGGSFSGFYTPPAGSLPATNTVGIPSFDVNLFNASQQFVATLATPDFGGNGSGALFPNFSGTQQDILVLDASGYQLQLDFTTPFNGVGPVIPTNPLGFSSFIIDPSGNFTNVASGTSAVAFSVVPEPSTALMSATAGAMGLGLWRARRRRTAA